MDNKQLLASWDNGETIKTVEMGGLSDGYEYAIHVIAMEMLRYMEDNPFNWDLFQDDPVLDAPIMEKYYTYMKEMEVSETVAAMIEFIGPSGAQFGAAKSIASVYSRQGYEKGLDMAPKDRIIEITKL